MIYQTNNITVQLNTELSIIEWTPIGVVPLHEWQESLNAGLQELIKNKMNKWLNNTTWLNGFTSEHIYYVNYKINDTSKLLVDSGLCPKIKIAFVKPLSLTGQNAVYSYICTTQIMYKDSINVGLFDTLTEAYNFLKN